MVILDDGETITAAEHAAQIVEGLGSSTSIEKTKVISVRLPVVLSIELMALAHKSGKTRNATIGTLLEVGLEEVRKHLSEQTLSEISAIQSEMLSDEYPALFNAGVEA